MQLYKSKKDVENSNIPIAVCCVYYIQNVYTTNYIRPECTLWYKPDKLSATYNCRY